MRACINTQTPLVIFNPNRIDIIERHQTLNKPLDVQLLTEGVDYRLAPGGVTKMVFHLVERMMKDGPLREAHWVSLNTNGPREAILDGVMLHNVRLPTERLRGYRQAKEVMWNVLHGLADKETVPSLQNLDGGVLRDYIYYNRASAETMARLDNRYDCDFFFIHCFQQLLVGHFLSTPKPKIFRWHVPFDDTVVPDSWREFLLAFLNSYETIIVSTRKYQEALRRFGYQGRTCYVYPYLDPSLYTRPSWSDLRDFSTRFGIEDDNRMILVVARMTPDKGQDRAIDAFAKFSSDRSDTKLVLVGDGTFSSSKEGLGLSKGAIWLEKLKKQAEQLGVEERVIFTGYADQRTLNAAYQRCDLTLLPSVAEGFGLVVVESWLFRKPTVVTERAGIIELIQDGQNGLVVDPDDVESIADKLVYLLDNGDEAERIGANGLITSERCSIRQGEDMVDEIVFGLRQPT